jgi:hypothetical protein
MPNKIIGWKPEDPPKETEEERQKKVWRKEVEDSPKPSSPWGQEPEPPGLLDNIAVDPKADPKGYATVLQERLRRMRENPQ